MADYGRDLIRAVEEGESVKARIAEIYDTRAAIPYDPDSDSAYITDDVMLVEETAGVCDRLLDAGCGLGWHIDKFIERGFPDVVGVDLSHASIEAARTRLQAGAGSGWRLLCEDLSNHRPSGPYAAIVSFLSCVGWFGARGDTALLKRLRALMSPGAPLIMTSFYREGVDALVGEFATKYASGSTVTLHTRATFDSQTSEIVFQQRIARDQLPGVQQVGEERIRLYTTSEMRSLFRAAGFSSAEVFPECQLNYAPRTVDRSGVMLTLAYA